MKNELVRFDYGISLIRVISMVFIVLCHIGGYIQSIYVTNFFNVGVPIFLLISGYLYGKRDIRNWKQFFFNRWRSLLIPAYIWVLFLLIITWIWQKQIWSWENILTFILNLQGYNFLLDVKSQWWYIPGLSHLWFLTALMLCYIVVLPLLQHARQSRRAWRPRWVIWFMLLLFSTISPLLLGVHIQYFIVFILGYLLCHEEKVFHLNRVWLWILLAAAACACRIWGRFLYDDTYIYDQVIVVLTHIALATGIFISLKSVYEHSKYIQRIALNETWRKVTLYTDRLSYYIYLTHFAFLNGIFTLTLTDAPYDELLYAVLSTLISSFALKIISDRVIAFFK